MSMSAFPAAAPVPPSATAASERDIPPADAAADRRWQRELAEAIRDPDELCRVLGLDSARAAEARAVIGDFPLLVPRSFVGRMQPGVPDDPLLLQVLPRGTERLEAEGFVSDPLHERDAVAAPGLVKKYDGRALLLATGGCAVNCRYCFRREFPYADSGASPAGLEAAIDAVAADASIQEAILSGGDPLLLDDERLAKAVRRLAAVPHVKRLRIHTRLPIVLPARVTAGLVRLLGATRLGCVVVVHANHPRELDADVAAAVASLRSSGAILLNQAVLLAGVNDDVDALAGLSERLVEIGIVPYYLHLLDRVRGTAAFEVAESRARRLHAELQARLPGYAVPRLAREVPGQPAKVWLA